MNRCLDLPALMKALRVSRNTVDRWMNRTDPVTRLHKLGGTRRILVAVTELDRFLRVNSYSERGGEVSSQKSEASSFQQPVTSKPTN